MKAGRVLIFVYVDDIFMIGEGNYTPQEWLKIRLVQEGIKQEVTLEADFH